ncbi:alpha/beta fold hydrolase [Streptomyces sp. NEAU-S77]|uniref:alpha/beta fold hydrolase n=1 Tax=Streptomyces sp. NEAU-S77 TaxID=3411033 RepID=UPI003BA266F1
MSTGHRPCRTPRTPPQREDPAPRSSLPHQDPITNAPSSFPTPAPSSCKNAPTRAVSVHGVDFAYRQHGPDDGVPLILLNHLSAVLDNWDPRVVDGLAARRRVITYDNRGVGASGGSTPDTIEAMARDTVLFIRAVGYDRVDLLGLSMGGFVAQVFAAQEPDLVRKMILAGTGPAGGPGIDKVTSLHHQGHPQGRRDPQGPQAVPLLHRHRKRPTGRPRLPGPAERAHGRPRQSHLALIIPRPVEGHPPLGRCREDVAASRRRRLWASRLSVASRARSRQGGSVSGAPTAAKRVGSSGLVGCFGRSAAAALAWVISRACCVRWDLVSWDGHFSTGSTAPSISRRMGTRSASERGLRPASRTRVRSSSTRASPNAGISPFGGRPVQRSSCHSWVSGSWKYTTRRSRGSRWMTHCFL